MDNYQRNSLLIQRNSSFALKLHSFRELIDLLEELQNEKKILNLILCRKLRRQIISLGHSLL
jgi:hypothetical protein